MKKIKLIETFEGVANIDLIEDINISEDVKPSRVDGKYIIGMIEGQFFQPDGMSRNKRWYPKSLWEKALNCADVKNRFLTSTMFGEIGHSEGPVEDLTLRNGCASHFVDKMWIDEKGRGMGRAYILNTPTGQLLKTYLGAGCKLKVSTRGEGLYKEGATHDGCPVVDDDSYELQTADFVINPGFLETSATLKEQYEKVSKEEFNKKQQKIIDETIAHVKKEGEKRMTLDMNAYVQELREELKSAKAEIKSLSEELKAKDKELLQKEFVESAEIKKINEEFAPFKKMKVSAKTLTETLKRSQKVLKETQEKSQKISEELESYKSKCGSLEEIDEATKLSGKALAMIAEYKKLGSVAELTTLKESAEKAVIKLGEADKLALNAKKCLAKLQEAKGLEVTAKKALKTIKEYHKLVGTLEDAKRLVESKAEVKKVSVTEALQVSKKFGCTVESAAKLIKKHGAEKASKLLEAAVAKKQSSKRIHEGVKEGSALVEEAAQLDKNPKIEAEKSAKDFLANGMIKNYFNDQALGKPLNAKDLNDIDGTKAQKSSAAKDLLKKYNGAFEVEKADVKVEKENTPAEAEAAANKVLKTHKS